MKKNLLIFAFFAIFMFLGITAMEDSLPSAKNERVYAILQKHMPYTLEKRVGGYSIVSNETGVKEKPPAKDLFLRLEQLEQQWGKEFLKLENNTLIILDKDKNKVDKIDLKTNEEINWVKEYFSF